jgi:hypothetical protein
MMNSKTVAFLFAMVSLGGMIAVPGLSTAAYAQIPDAQSIVDGVLDDVFGDDEEAAATEDESNTQTIEQPIDQDIDQEVDQSEENDQDNDNTQTQVGAIDQDINQGIEDGDDSAKSSSESGDAKKKDSSSSSSSGDAENENQQGATNDARLQQLQVQNVDQDNFAEFGDDTADLDAANVAIPIAIPINLQEELEEVEEPEPPVEDTITICEDEVTQEVTLEELQELIDEDVEFTFGECPDATTP